MIPRYPKTMPSADIPPKLFKYVRLYPSLLFLLTVALLEGRIRRCVLSYSTGISWPLLQGRPILLVDLVDLGAMKARHMSQKYESYEHYECVIVYGGYVSKHPYTPKFFKINKQVCRVCPRNPLHIMGINFMHRPYIVHPRGFRNVLDRSQLRLRQR